MKAAGISLATLVAGALTGNSLGAAAQTVVRVPAGTTVVVQQEGQLEAPAKKLPGTPVVAEIEKSAVSGIRTAALKEAWLGSGAKAGLAERTNAISEMLLANADKLDAVFNFAPLMLEATANADYNLPPILPPVIVEAENTFSMQDGRTVRTVDKVYKVVAQAKFAPVPTWRTYLLKSYDLDKSVEPSVAPRNAEEQKVAASAYSAGFARGAAQADQIIDLGFNALLRDYRGMIQYRILQTKGMVTRPFVARTDSGVTGDDGELNLNEATLRITELPVFSREPSKWSGAEAPASSQAPSKAAPRPTPAPAAPSLPQVAKPAPDNNAVKPLFSADELSTYKRDGSATSKGGK